MKKFNNVSKIKFFGFVFLMIIVMKSNAQINPKIYMDEKELPEMLHRKMIIALMDENPDEVKRLEKKEKKNPEGLTEYRNEIKEFNDYLKAGVEKYWKLNSDYEYKSMTEVNELMKDEKKNKSHKYMVLSLGYLSDTEMDFSTRSSITIRVLIWTRAEEKQTKPDYKIYIPNSNVREKVMFTQTDISFGLIAMQNNIRYIQSKNKVLNFDDYVHDVAKQNCSRMTGKTILIDKALLEAKPLKEEEAKIKDKYKGAFKIVDHDEIDKAFEEGRENTVILMCIPYGIMKGSFIIVSSSLLVTAKITVDCSTKEILNQHEYTSGLGLMGKVVSPLIQPRNVEGVAQCK